MKKEMVKGWAEKIMAPLKEIVKRGGHGMSYEANKALFDIKSVYEPFNEMVVKSQVPFLIPTAEENKYKIIPEKAEEFADLTNKFENEVLEFEITPIPKDKLEKALKEGKLDGIDISDLYHIVE